MATENTIALENQLPGTPQSVWGINGPDNIEGFTTDISVNHGNTIVFKINTDSSDYRIEIYRLGYYGGDGARLVDTIQHQSYSFVAQPGPLYDETTRLIDAGNWEITDSWDVPADAVSGHTSPSWCARTGPLGRTTFHLSSVTMRVSPTLCSRHRIRHGRRITLGAEKPSITLLFSGLQ